MKRYPDSDGIFLRNVLAKKFKLDSNRIILGSGSDQIFELICKAFLNKNDEVIEQDGVRVLIAPSAQRFLFGTEIDYETSLLESAFKFNNPNVSEACGCGESIKFKDI